MNVPFAHARTPAPDPRARYKRLVLFGFDTEQIGTSEVAINVCRGGTGLPLLLLHGYPQTHVMWHRVASALAERFTVICPDLRGYGDSDKPPGGDDHSAYSKRVMAGDQLEVMHKLGFERFAVAGHDRGARVALRLALDHPDAVSHLAVLDIVPTNTIYVDTCAGRSMSGAAPPTHSTRRRSPSISAASTRRQSTPPARTTGPARASTSITTEPMPADPSAAQRSGYGAKTESVAPTT